MFEYHYRNVTNYTRSIVCIVDPQSEYHYRNATNYTRSIVCIVDPRSCTLHVSIILMTFNMPCMCVRLPLVIL